jgi:hypothetical protein
MKGWRSRSGLEQVPECRAALAAGAPGHQDQLGVVTWQLTLLGSSAAF